MSDTHAPEIEPLLGVIVPTVDGGEPLLKAVAAVLANPIPLELFVIDQSASDASQRGLKARGLLADRRLNYYRLPTRGGCLARNMGARATRAPIVAFVDHDCVVGPTWAETIVRRFALHPKMALSFHALLAPPGEAARPDSWTPVFRPPVEGRIRKSWRCVDQLGFGGNCAMRKEAFLRVGLFDEQLGPGSAFGAGEDTDLGYRALLAGLGVYVFWEPVAIHLGRRDGAAASVQGTRYVKSMAGYCLKHARCGDLDMLFPIAIAEAQFFARGIRHLLRGERPSGFRAAHGILAGLAAGRRLRVNRVARLYSAAPSSR